MTENINYMQVGDMTACGHCEPDKYVTAESQGGVCTCNCHKSSPNKNIEGWEEEFFPFGETIEIVKFEVLNITQ